MPRKAHTLSNSTVGCQEETILPMTLQKQSDIPEVPPGSETNNFPSRAVQYSRNFPNDLRYKFPEKKDGWDASVKLLITDHFEIW